MKIPVTSLFSPKLQEGHPLSIRANVDAGNDDPSTFDMTTGGIATYNKFNEYLLSWPKINNAVKYRLYGSVSPLRQFNLLEDNITNTQTKFVPPTFTEVIEYYFWISAVDEDGNEAYLSDDPASLETLRHSEAFSNNPVSFDENMSPDPDGWNNEFKHDLEYIRSGNRFQLQNDGEDALLFLRRYGADKPWGIPCACNNSLEAESDPDYQGRGRCTMCFGTGVAGGFYPQIPIRIRYSNTPGKRYINSKAGLEVEHKFNTFMLWAPIVRVGDLVVRLEDGSRYTVSMRSESSARAIRLHQEFDIEQISVEDIKMLVTDQAIEKGLNQAKVPGFNRSGFKSFG